ncbi:hypothetical protein HDU79_010947 [Rhizoclosmatium sp. JEL0117]|nr:hypothetical protein HDU79_010947 [Rhizoclosmatium sp. JEL0117]
MNLVEQECNNPNGVPTYHTLAGAIVILQIRYNSNSNRKLEIFFANNNPGEESIISLSDYKNPSSPVLGPFYPPDKGHNPALFYIKVPNVSPGDGYAIFYRYYLLNTFTEYNASTVALLTIDTDKSTWITPSITTLSSATPTNTNSSSIDSPSSPASTAWTAIIISMVVVALAMTIGGFLVGRFMKKKKEADRVGNMASPVSRDLVLAEAGQFLPSNGEIRDKRASVLRNSVSGNGGFPNFNTDDGHNSDDEVIIFRKPADRSYTASVVSGVSSGTNGSQPKSILKKREEVEREALEAQMYDPILMNHQHQHQEHTALAVNNVRNQKFVSFREDVQVASFDSKAPASANPVLPQGLFAESEVGQIIAVEEEDSEENPALDFHDGGVERDVAILMAKAVEIEDEDEDYNSDVSDSWRQE